MIHYNRLIRDNVPEMVKRKGKKIEYHQAAVDEEYWYVLLAKLQEESNEFAKDSSMEQLGDIIDVIDAIIAFKKFDLKELRALRENKNNELGGFEKRWVLEKSEEEIGERQEQPI
jgi:predicted house-cleaning noncanonical NTP pyrophosphatase (MazG superfamily)